MTICHITEKSNQMLIETILHIVLKF